MPLKPVNRPGYENMQGVHFAMMHDDVSLRVLITRAALQGDGSPLSQGGCLARFETYRDVYETVAREKFETARCRGSMTITLDDLGKFLTERRHESPSQRRAA